MISFTPATPPGSETELLHRAAQLAGKTLAQLAQTIDSDIPSQQRHAKGWIGTAVESYLGASAASKPEPDFPQLGIELKTLPVNRHGRPKESTYVCIVPLTGLTNLTWEHSNVRKKLARVLWVPIEADPGIPLATRRFGNAFLWSPDVAQEMDLRTDWEEIMEMIHMGDLSAINSRFGKVMQIRPKGMNARALTRTETETGESGLTLPRGFYLRASFTHEILERRKA
ncbi:MAG: DNA mismatch repair protein MutH [Gammaproteobacteria bacterium]|nr:DNA mismatch repair protein MutH [Gammaproteobacteria bacterium]